VNWVDFDIAFVKFKAGSHKLEYLLNEDFFSLFEFSSYTNGRVEAEVILHKELQNFQLQFAIKGEVKTECDRCLEPLIYPIQNTYTLHVKVTENVGEEVDNLVYLHPTEFKFNIAQYLYEMIHLGIPMKKVCEEVGRECDPMVLAKIEGFSNESETSEVSNPFEKLKDLFKDKL
jgi:uncharacterized metal-binding protein YceD (DUF177 family)